MDVKKVCTSVAEALGGAPEASLNYTYPGGLFQESALKFVIDLNKHVAENPAAAVRLGLLQVTAEWLSNMARRQQENCAALSKASAVGSAQRAHAVRILSEQTERRAGEPVAMVNAVTVLACTPTPTRPAVRDVWRMEGQLGLLGVRLRGHDILGGVP
jgi:hypothetical protein